MDEKITIIEGPPPTFEIIPGGWVTGIIESPNLANVAVTRLRTFNGGELVERCHRMWRQQQPIHLEYRTPEGINQQVPIIAARNTETLDGQMLLLWVRLPNEEFEVEFDCDFDDDDDEEFDDFDPGDFPEDIGPYDLRF